ncbi:hypothetical protein HDU98_007168 [Podochytrium sp. JEL0797]|nr:hypothetical protein HDU98_007168 [Podochytrium sp. JEL0797]
MDKSLDELVSINRKGGGDDGTGYQSQRRRDRDAGSRPYARREPRRERRDDRSDLRAHLADGPSAAPQQRKPRRRRQEGFGVVVANLHYNVLAETLADFVAQHLPRARVTAVEIDYDSADRSLGTASVRFDSQVDAVQARNVLHGMSLENEVLEVVLAEDSEALADDAAGVVNEHGEYMYKTILDRLGSNRPAPVNPDLKQRGGSVLNRLGSRVTDRLGPKTIHSPQRSNDRGSGDWRDRRDASRHNNSNSSNGSNSRRRGEVRPEDLDAEMDRYMNGDGNPVDLETEEKMLVDGAAGDAVEQDAEEESHTRRSGPRKEFVDYDTPSADPYTTGGGGGDLEPEAAGSSKQEEEAEIVGDVSLQPQVPTDVAPDGGGIACGVVLASFCVHFFCLGTLYTFGVYAVQYESMDLDRLSVISFIGSIGTTVTVGAGLLSGRLAERFGAQIMISVGAACMSLSLLLASFATQTWQFMVSQGFLFGLGCSLCYFPSLASIAQWWDKKRSIATGVAASGSGIGGLVLSLVTQHLLNTVGLAWTLRVNALLILVVLGLTIPLVRQRIPISRRPLDWSILRNLKFQLLLGSVFFAMTPNFIPAYFLPSFAKDVNGLNAGQGALLLVSGGYFVLIPVIVGQVFGVAQLASLVGMSMTLSSIGYLAGPPIAGAIRDSVGYTGVCMFAGGLTVMSVLFCVALRVAVERKIFAIV